MPAKNPGIRLWLKLIALVTAVVLLSFFSANLWQGKPETKADPAPLVFRDGMTIAEFGNENELPKEVLKKAFQLQSKEDLQKTVESLNIPRNEIAGRVSKARTLEAEYESKNWVKIPLKFGLWVLFLVGVFVLMRHRKITPGLRRRLWPPLPG